MNIFRKAAAAIATAALVTTLSTGGTQLALANEYVPVSSISDGGERTGEIRVGTTWETATVVSTPSDEVSRNIPFSPLDTANCNLANDASWEIATHDTYPYGTVWNGGTVRLLCGTDNTSGFKHIRAGHQWGSEEHSNSWEAFRTLAIEEGANPLITWDQFMWNATKDVLDISIPFPKIHTPQKLCFSNTFNIWDGTQVVYAFYANTIISETNSSVLTSYLSDTYVSDC